MHEPSPRPAPVAKLAHGGRSASGSTFTADSSMGFFRNRRLRQPLQPAPPDEASKIPALGDELVLLRDPHGPASEQYRRLRNSIQALNPDGAPRTVVITSAVEGEGKTVATLNLATALTELPRLRVVVLDGDFRAPSVERYLGLPRRQGITEVLRGDLPLDAAIRQTCVDRLDIIAAGEKPKNPSELMNVDRIKSVLHSLKRRYDYVLIDTTPALDLNDPSMLGAIADGILLVVRLGGAPRHLVEEAQQLLENLGGNILGTCLTGAPPGKRKKSYGTN